MARQIYWLWAASALVLALLLSANGVESQSNNRAIRRRGTQLENQRISSRKANAHLQNAVEELLHYGAHLRWEIVDTLGKLVYDHYDNMNLGQLETLYRIYHDTLRRKYNIFEIAPSLSWKNRGLQAKDICRAVNNNVCSSKENSKICSSLQILNHRRSTSINSTFDVPESIYKYFPHGVNIPALLNYIRTGNLRITPKLFAGLISSAQYDSFNNDVLRAEKTLVEYLDKLPDYTVFSTSENLNSFASLDLLLKALLQHNSDQFPGQVKRSALILADHVERDLNSISNNIEYFGIIYENKTINLKYLLDLVIPDDLVDTDIIEARDNLEQVMQKNDFPRNYLSIDKYRHTSPDQLVLEILRQMNYVNHMISFPKNILRALRMHAEFWRKERTIDDVSDFLRLFNAYDNLLDNPEYKTFFQLINLIKEKLKHSEDVNLELTCTMPRPCLRKVLLKILECNMVDDETKRIVTKLLKSLNSKGTPKIADRSIPEGFTEVPDDQPFSISTVRSTASYSGVKPFPSSKSKPNRDSLINNEPIDSQNINKPVLPKGDSLKDNNSPSTENININQNNNKLLPSKGGPLIDNGSAGSRNSDKPSSHIPGGSTASNKPHKGHRPHRPGKHKKQKSSKCKGIKNCDPLTGKPIRKTMPDEKEDTPLSGISGSNVDEKPNQPIVSPQGEKSTTDVSKPDEPPKFQSPSTNTPIESSTIPKQTGDDYTTTLSSKTPSQLIGGDTTLSLDESNAGTEQGVTKSSSETIDENTTILPSKTTTYVPLKDKTMRKLSTEDDITTVSTIIKPEDQGSTGPISMSGDKTTTISSRKDDVTPKRDCKDGHCDDQKSLEECLKSCLNDSSEEECEASCEKSVEKSCQGPDCPDTSRSTECESGSEEDCSLENRTLENVSSSSGGTSHSTPSSDVENSTEDCSDSNSANCKSKSSETTESCENGDCTQENKEIKNISDSSEESKAGSGVICDSLGCFDKSEADCTGTICKRKVLGPSSKPQTCLNGICEDDCIGDNCPVLPGDVNKSGKHPSTSATDKDEDDEGKLCGTKDPHRKRKSERLNRIRKLNAILAEEEALDLLGNEQYPNDINNRNTNININKLRDKYKEKKKLLGPLLERLRQNEEDVVKHKNHQNDRRRISQNLMDNESDMLDLGNRHSMGKLKNIKIRNADYENGRFSNDYLKRRSPNNLKRVKTFNPNYESNALNGQKRIKGQRKNPEYNEYDSEQNLYRTESASHPRRS